jgi:hypothetical protein
MTIDIEKIKKEEREKIKHELIEIVDDPLLLIDYIKSM